MADPYGDFAVSEPTVRFDAVVSVVVYYTKCDLFCLKGFGRKHNFFHIFTEGENENKDHQNG